MCFTSVSRVPPVVVRGLKLWAVQNFLPRPTPFRFFSASCHVYKSTVARLKLDINANNIVCFTGGHFLTGFGRDQAVKRCVTGPLLAFVRGIHRRPVNSPHKWPVTRKMFPFDDVIMLWKTRYHFDVCAIMIWWYRSIAKCHVICWSKTGLHDLRFDWKPWSKGNSVQCVYLVYFILLWWHHVGIFSIKLFVNFMIYSRL